MQLEVERHSDGPGGLWKLIGSMTRPSPALQLRLREVHHKTYSESIAVGLAWAETPKGLSFLSRRQPVAWNLDLAPFLMEAQRRLADQQFAVDEFSAWATRKAGRPPQRRKDLQDMRNAILWAVGEWWQEMEKQETTWLTEGPLAPARAYAARMARLALANLLRQLGRASDLLSQNLRKAASMQTA